MRIANATNGLAFPPYDAVSMFLSTHGHNCKLGYFLDYAMPWNAVITLLKGETIKIVDATRNNRKPLPDSFKFGVTTWAIVFNRAILKHSKLIEKRHVKVAEWETPEMRHVAYGRHDALVGRIRRLEKLYGHKKLAIIGDNILLEVHNHFLLDDKPTEMRMKLIELGEV